MVAQSGLPIFLVLNFTQYAVVAILGAAILLALLWILVGRVYYLRQFYERQGVVFVQNCYPVIGAELKVSKIRKSNQTHDQLYRSEHGDLIGTIRGSTVQLYGISAEICNKLLHETGKSVDRNSPALFSFGRLSPFAITFLPMSAPLFRQRKANIIRALNDTGHLHEIASRHAAIVLKSFHEYKQGGKIDIREVLRSWSRGTSGEFIWGPKTVTRTIRAYNSTGQLVDLPIMAALNVTFTALRFYSNSFWNRLYFPLAAWPITEEARHLTYNIRNLRREFESILAHPEKGSVAEKLKRENDIRCIPFSMTRDDLMTVSVGGLDTVTSLTMATLWNLLQPSNKKWKDNVISELEYYCDKSSKPASPSSGQSETLNAAILETLRLDPPGSLINNQATADFELILPEKTYRIKSGTRIVSCIHALHRNSNCWNTEPHPDMRSLNQFDPSRFIQWGNDIIGSSYFMPFGRGPRRCPGQATGLSMVKVFASAFLQSHSECLITIPEEQSRECTSFHIMSKATFNVHCHHEPPNEIETYLGP